MKIDAQAFRDALGRFATGVSVITAAASDGRAVGVTVSSFASLSLEPPLILFCLGLNTDNLEAYASHGAVCINVLAEGQLALSERFAIPGGDKFAGFDHRPGDNGCQVLDGCLVSLECSIVNEYVGGDHLIIVGRVERLHRDGEGKPLLRFRGDYAKLGEIVP